MDPSLTKLLISNHSVGRFQIFLFYSAQKWILNNFHDLLNQNKKFHRSLFHTKVNILIFWGPPFPLVSPSPLNFFKKIYGSLVSGETTEHVGPKIVCLAPIGAEISQVRFDAIFFLQKLENLRWKTTLSFPAEISLVYIIAA